MKEQGLSAVPVLAELKEAAEGKKTKRAPLIDEARESTSLRSNAAGYNSRGGAQPLPVQSGPEYIQENADRRNSEVRAASNVLIDDGGRTFPQEKGDCTVRAVAWATGMGYAKAHALLAKHGRKLGKGFKLAKFLRDAAPFPVQELHNVRHRTFGRFAREHPRGSFIIRREGHAAPVVDGVIIDLSNSSKCRVIQAWEIL